MSDSMRRHYGLGAVSRSLRHFVLGKSFTAATSIAVLFLLARLLEPAAYAAYVALQALVMLIGRVSGVGAEKVMYRYLPELRATNDHAAAYGLLWKGTLLRFATVGAALLAAGALLPLVGEQFGLDGWLWLVPWYLLVGLFRLMNQWIHGMLESFLWQRESQYSMAAAGFAKLAAVMLLAPHMDLALLVVIEMATEALAVALLVAGGLRRWRADPDRAHGSRNWWTENRARALRYGFWGFLQTQSRLMYGSAPNRLVAAHFLPAPELALFGLADNVINIVRRFMPAQLFIGLIRPVAIARFAATGDFTQVAWMSNLAYRLNLLLLVLGIALLTSVGEPILDLLTGGRYGAAAWLVAGMLVLMGTEGMRIMVELMAQAVERNYVFFGSNLIQSLSLAIALPLIHWIGLWSLIVANIAGTVAANLLVIVRLRRAGYRFRLNVKPVALIGLYGGAAALSGWLLARELALPPLLVAGLVTGLYGLLCFLRPPLDADERALLRRLLERRSERKRARAAAEVGQEAD